MSSQVRSLVDNPAFSIRVLGTQVLEVNIKSLWEEITPELMAEYCEGMKQAYRYFAEHRIRFAVMYDLVSLGLLDIGKVATCYFSEVSALYRQLSPVAEENVCGVALFIATTGIGPAIDGVVSRVPETAPRKMCTTSQEWQDFLIDRLAAVTAAPPPKVRHLRTD